MGQAGNADLPGNVGPDLSEIGDAGREDEWLFNYIYDARVYNPETVMPPWGSHGFFNDEEINHMVAFLKTLKSPAVFKTALDDPNKRPAPVENRDNLDPIDNPGMSAVDKAPRALERRAARPASSCKTCHADAEGQVQDLGGASMPKWEPRLNKVLGVEEFVTRHAKATTGADWLMESDENLRDVGLSALSRQWRRRSRSTPRAPEPKAAIERGKELDATQGRPAQLGLHSTAIRQRGGRNGSAASGSASSARASTIISRPGAPACWRSGTSASASSGARSTSAPTNCRRTPRNMAIWNCISRRAE